MKAALLVLITLPFLAFGANTVAFDAETYVRAFAHTDSKTGSVTEEFLRAGETLKKWKIMVSVRYFPKATSPAEVATSWLQMIKNSNLPGHSIREEVIEGKSRETELMFMASLRAPDDSYLELCWCRIVKEPWAEGIKMYQVSHRLNPKSERELLDVFKKTVSWKDQVKAMLIDVSKAEPEQ